ncbi:MAG: molybdopterin-dependent oxidoreductase [Actinomycetota bacterium]
MTGIGRSAFWRGALAMGLTLVLVFAVNSAFPFIGYPPAVVAAFIIDATPGGLATEMIERLGKAAIRSLAIGVNVVIALAGGVLAMWINKPALASSRALRALAAAAVVFAGSALLGLGAVGVEFRYAGAAYALAALAFAKMATDTPLLAAVEPKRVEGDETPLDAMTSSRRRFLVRAGWLLAGVLAAGGVFRAIRSRGGPRVPIAGADRPYGGPADGGDFPHLPGQTPEITSNDDFYNIDINIVKPAVDHQTWTLKVGGLVDDPYELTFQQLQNDFEVVEIVHTLTCISNRVGGDLISTAVWRGVRLRDVLERAGLQPGIVDLIFTGAEGYTDSIPVNKGMQDDTLVVFGMNGESLPREHGFPARIIVPGIYGMKNVKWLTAIEAVDVDYKGYWMVRGWSDTARIKTSSRFDLPTESSRVQPGARLAGVAWAGDRGVRRVEISADGGKTWSEALLKRELSPITWRLWAAELEHASGEVKVLVRAVDGSGGRQEGEPTDPHPDGASGYHEINLTVV